MPQNLLMHMQWLFIKWTGSQLSKITAWTSATWKSEQLVPGLSKFHPITSVRVYFLMVLISESHVFISWMHVDTSFGTNPNINTKNGGILNTKSLHISRTICQVWENIPLMFTRCLFLLHANWSLWGYMEWF